MNKECLVNRRRSINYDIVLLYSCKLIRFFWQDNHNLFSLSLCRANSVPRVLQGTTLGGLTGVLLGTRGITRDYSGGRFLGVLKSCMSVSVTREPNMLQGTTLG